MLRTLAALAVVLGTVSACSGDGDVRPPSRADVAALLARHTAAVRDGDRSAWSRDVAAGAFRDAQDVVFTNLRRLPLRTYRLTLGPAVSATSEGEVRAHRGADATVVRVTVTYQLTGSDPAPARHDLYWTVGRRSGRTVLLADDDLAGEGGASWRGPWDFGELAVVRGRDSLVIGHPGATPSTTAVAAVADAAVPVVRSVVGDAWPRPVVLWIPASDAERSTALGADAQLDVRIGAVAVTAGRDPLDGTPSEPRVVVDPTTWPSLTAVGTRILLQHEITHVALSAATGDETPPWLVEGTAEYVGNLGSGQPLRTAAAELTRQVRRGAVPTALPGAAALTARGTAAVAYESAWTACRLVVQRLGAAGLVRLYRAVGRAATPQQADAALRAGLGESTAAFVARWRAWLREELR